MMAETTLTSPNHPTIYQRVMHRKNTKGRILLMPTLLIRTDNKVNSLKAGLHRTPTSEVTRPKPGGQDKIKAH